MKRTFFYGLVALLLVIGGGKVRQWFRETRAPNFRVLAFSPDGKTLAVGSDYGVVGLWDTASGKLKRRLRIRRAPYCLAFSPDSRVLAVGTGTRNPYNDREQPVLLFDADGGGRLLTLNAHVDSVVTLAFDTPGKRLVSGGLDASAEEWDATTGWRLQDLVPPGATTDPIRRVAFTPSGDWVAASRDEQVYLWDGHGHLVRELTGGADDAMAFLDDVTLFGFDGLELRVWRVVTSQVQARRTLDAPGRAVCAPQADEVIVADADGGVDLLRANDLHLESSIHVSDGAVLPAVTRAGDRVAVREFGRVQMFRVVRDSEGHRALERMWTRAVSMAAPGRWTDLRFSDDGTLIAVGDPNRVNVLTVPDGKFRFSVGRPR